MSNDDDFRTAIHEAGHAVVGRFVGMLCGGVTIERDDTGSAFSITGDPHEIQHLYEQHGRFITPEKIFRRRIITFMAGAEAEVIMFGACAGGDGDDRLQIEMMLGELDELGDRDIIEATYRRRSREFVRNYFMRIKRLAERLVCDRTLTGEQVDQIVGVYPPKFLQSKTEPIRNGETITIRRPIAR